MYLVVRQNVPSTPPKLVGRVRLEGCLKRVLKSIIKSIIKSIVKEKPNSKPRKTKIKTQKSRLAAQACIKKIKIKIVFQGKDLLKLIA